MKSSRLFALLRGITLTGLILGFVPFVLYFITSLCLGQCAPAAAWALCAAALFFGYLGYGVRLLGLAAEQANKGKPVVHRMLWIIFGVACAAIVCRTQLHHPVTAILWSVVLLADYLVAGKLVTVRCERLFQEMALTASALLGLTCYFGLYLIGKTKPIILNESAFLVTMLAVVFCYLVSRNQANLSYLMERRRLDLSLLPQKIRRYNLCLLLVLFLLLIALYLCRGWLAILLWRVVEWFRAAGKWILRAILWLINRLANGGTVTESAGDDLPQMETAPLQVGYSVDYTIFALICLAGLWFQYHREIVAWLREKFALLLQWIKAILFSHTKLQHPAAQNTYYTDTVETILSEKGVRAKQRATHRAWKRRYRRYQKLEGGEKLRAGFSLWMDWLRLQGEELPPSATVTDIAARTERYLPNNAHTAAQGYALLRYADQAPTPTALSAMNDLLAGLSQQHRLKKF